VTTKHPSSPAHHLGRHHLALALALCLLSPTWLHAGAFIGASEGNPGTILHPHGYTGTGGPLTVSVCLDPASTALPQMDIPMRNVITVWNALASTTNNLRIGANSELQADEVDWESTILHELGHCIGLAHPNAATESGLPNAQRDYTKVADGPNNMFDLDPGADGIIGSADDVRGDDVNLHWYRIGSNIPFVLPATVDFTNYSRTLGNLPPGDLFAANADRTVSTLFGVPNTEASMQQGAFFDEEQRSLVADDVATFRLGMSGLDEIEGTADDYTIDLVYAGVTNSCDVVVRLNAGGSFAFCQTSSTAIPGTSNHRRLTFASVTTGNFNWFFTTKLIGGSEIFADGFEAGNTMAWSNTVP
jgi:hypothetical protein